MLWLVVMFIEDSNKQGVVEYYQLIMFSPGLCLQTAYLAIHPRDQISDLVDLWVIKIKKPMIPCACSTWRSREESTKRESVRFSFSVVKLKRYYDY